MIAGYVCSVVTFNIVGEMETFQLNDWDVDDDYDDDHHDHGLDDHDLTRNRLDLSEKDHLTSFLFPWIRIYSYY